MSSDEIISPDEWRELANAAAGVPPDITRQQCRALKRTGERCKLSESAVGIGVCRFHGGGILISQDQARRRIEMVRSAMFDELCEAALEAVEVYVEVMRRPTARDADRLRAADRVLMLVGLEDRIVEAPKSRELNEDDIDSQLLRLLATAAPASLTRAIETTATEADVDTSR